MRGKVGPDRAAVSATAARWAPTAGAPGACCCPTRCPAPWCSGWRACRRPATGTTAAACCCAGRWTSRTHPARRRILALPDRAALTRWGLPAGPAQPAPTLDLPLTPAHERAADEALAAAGLAGKRFVLIAPTATGLHKGKVKVWPGFDTLTRGLQNQGHTVVMCPSPAETDEARRNAPTAQLLPPLSLGAFAALTARSALVICNDSGVRTWPPPRPPGSSLFGVTRPGRTGPWSPRAVCVGAEDAWPPEDEVERQARRLLDGQQ